MKKHHTIIIAGAGGIAEAVGLLLMEWSDVTPTVFIGDRTHSKAKNVADWIQEGTTKSGSIQDFHLAEKGITDEMDMQIKITVKVKRHFCKCCFDY